MSCEARIRTAAFAFAALASAGCSTMGSTPAERAGAGSSDPAFGETTKYNAAMHIIDPDPVYAATDAQPGDHGAKGVAAVRRYRTDQVKQVERMETTTSTSGSGSGSSQ